MAYAEISDMVLRFGEVELTRLSVAEGQPLDAINTATVQRALDEASAQIDTGLRKRYQVPLDPAPDEVKRACCILARYDLAFGDGREPSEQMRLARKETIEWLVRIADGKLVLDGGIPTGDESYSMVSDRAAPLSADPFTPNNYPYPGGSLGSCPYTDQGLG